MYADGEKVCVTLEPPDAGFTSESPLQDILDKKAEELKTVNMVWPKGKRIAIPCGTYPVKMLFSNKFSRVVPHIMNVPGFDAIEIHIGNFPKDTDGCTLVGAVAGNDFISDSKATFENIVLPLITKACEEGDVTITITKEAA